MSNRIVGQVAKELIAAKARIENPENWCQGDYRVGHAYCALGTLEVKLAPLGGLHPTVVLLDFAAREIFGDVIPKGKSRIAWVNDQIGHSAVMQLYDHAIQRALSEGR